MSRTGRLFLIDGMSVIYRAYHAIRHLSTRAGLPTNATYGFITALRKVIAEQKPDYLGVALEGGPTLRQAGFAQYKAHRKPMPEELALQLPYVERVCAALRVPVIRHPGYEADDVIGTLATKAAARGLSCVIVTIDKDMFQLISDQILVLDPRHDVFMDAQAVEAKMGVPPNKIIDWLALAGDASDNVPGAPGIGDKGARELVAQFGNVEACLARYAEVQRKTYRESLRDNVELIRQCHQLVTIPTDLPIELDLDQLRLSAPDLGAIQALYTELEFHSLLKEIAMSRSALVPPAAASGSDIPSSMEGSKESPGAGSAQGSPRDEVKAPPASELSDRSATSADYREIQASVEIDELLQRIRQQGRVAISFARGPRVGFAFSSGVDRAAFLALPEPASSPSPVLAAVQSILSDSTVTKIFYDSKEAHYRLSSLQNPPAVPCADVSLMAYLIDPNAASYRLSKLAYAYCDYPMRYSEESGNELDTDAQIRGTCEEADILGRLEALLKPKLSSAGLDKLYYEMELPLVAVLVNMEEAGVRVDAGQLNNLSRSLQTDLERLRLQIFEMAGIEFNLNSPKQLGEVLFEKLQLPFTRRTQKTKNYSTDSDALELLAETYELPRLILMYRQLAKLKSTYVDALPKLINEKTGRIHTSYRQTVAATGRLSSSDPNFQNLPVRTEMGRKIRAAVIPDPGCRLLSADYSQIELRVLAHFSQDPVLLQAFRLKEDIHERTAHEVFGLLAQTEPAECRRRAKTINFGIIYGQTAFGLSRELRISRSEAQRFIDAYFERYRGVKAWVESSLEAARRSGFVKTLFGRIRQLPGIQSKDSNLRSFAERMAINSPIQGTAADLIKMAMIDVQRVLQDRRLATRMILQVHDELVFEIPEAELTSVRSIVREKMEQVFSLDVPLVVDVRSGENWRDLQKEEG
ncbi:MAG: DNA polymerase I [Acidobacteria bacterium]|nr:DNA polymerase I [Acidobacteriota bacterium]